MASKAAQRVLEGTGKALVRKELEEPGMASDRTGRAGRTSKGAGRASGRVHTEQ